MDRITESYDFRIDPIFGFPPEVWHSTQPTSRVARIKARLRETPRELDIERARFATESYQQSEGEPMPIRRARMLQHLVHCMSITIGDDELIVGNRSLLPRMGVIAPEGAVNWVDRELESLPTRSQDPFAVNAESIAELRHEVFPYWQGKTLEDVVATRIPYEIQAAVEGKAFSLNQTDHAQGHIIPDVTEWLHLGVRGLRQEVCAAMMKPEAQSPERQVFYQAALIALDAAHEFIQRYAELADKLAAKTMDQVRRQELKQIAATCEWLSEKPPRDFHGALQSVWFLFALLQIESNASSFSPGRFDQYMLPFLERDLGTGQLSLDSAQELLESLWLKFNENVLLRSSSSARYFAGFPIGFNIALGGQHTDGSDATNLLSYMCLRAQADLGLTQPNLSIRIHKNSPRDFLMTAAFVIGKGSGMPQVFNDEVIIPGQLARGISPNDAMNYAVVGCVELSTPGKALGWSDAAMLNMVRVLELTLFGGRDPNTDHQIGLPTPPLDAMQSFADLEAAYDMQLAHFVELMVRGCNIVDATHAEMLPSPFLSLVIADCIGRGIDVTNGGAHYNFSGVQGVQLANVADSLAAIQQAVFDEKWLDARRLLAVLRHNFEGDEMLRQRLINHVPKFGNDDDRVDDFYEKWADRYSELVGQHENIRDGIYQPGFYTVSAHVPMGANVGATPDGRRAGDPLADGGLSPTAGRDRKGPTAVLNSVSKPDLHLASNGTLLNMKFLPAFFENDHGLEKFVDMLRGFCKLKIPHVQFNVVSGKMLREAQVHPDEYRYLVVRVAGYSAYFVELDKGLQEEIIRRTEFS